MFATLKDRAIQDEVLGHDADVVARPYTVENYTEVARKLPDDTYPTLERAPRGRVTGEILDVSDGDLLRLDAWESDYHRIRVAEWRGRVVWTYVLRDDAVHLVVGRVADGNPEESSRSVY